MNKEIVVVHGQNLHDICFQHYGSYDGLADLIERNPNTIKSIDQLLSEGMVLNIGEPIDADLVDYYIANKVDVVSGLEAVEGEVDNGIFSQEFSQEFG